MDNIINYCELIMAMLIAKAPKDTWNMVNTIGYVVYDDNNIEIIIGGSFAPYAPYTNEKWISPRWNGKHNPNEGWFTDIIEQASILLASLNEGWLIINV